MLSMSRGGVLLVFLAILSAPAYGQQHESSEPEGGPFTREAVLNTPFSADAITRVRETLPDGAIREHTLTARYYRDSLGRVRAELDTAWGPYVVLWVPGPDRGAFYAIDPASRTYRIAGHFLAVALFNGEGRVALPVGKARYRYACPVLRGSARERLEAVHAKTSPDLGVVIASHRSDQIGSVDFELTNISRAEPPAQLLEVSPDFALVDGSLDDPLVQLQPWSPAHGCTGPTP